MPSVSIDRATLTDSTSVSATSPPPPPTSPLPHRCLTPVYSRPPSLHFPSPPRIVALHSSTDCTRLRGVVIIVQMMRFEEAKVQETTAGYSSSPVRPVPSSSSSSSVLTSRKPDLFDPAQSQPQPRPSLIRYQPPQPADKAAAAASSHLTTSAPLQAAGAKRSSGGDAQKPLSSLSELLNAILPPRSLVDPATGQLQLQAVSTEASSREEVIALQRQLDDSLQERQARSTPTIRSPLLSHQLHFLR